MVRVVLAALMTVTLPLYVTAAQGYLPLLILYLASTICFQIAIVKDFGGAYRVLAGGIVDTALITFIVHRTGSATSALAVVYPFIGMFNALAVPPWATLTLAAIAVTAYSGVVFAAALRWVPYAPDLPQFAAFVPDMKLATICSLMMLSFMAVTTLMAIRIARAVQVREEELKTANARLEELSQQDPLTLLYNRRYFVRRAQEELERVRRGHPMVVLMMDLDGFKQVNDTFGHVTGDEVLKSIAAGLQTAVRSVDVVARFGGDEFVVMLTDTGPEEAAVVAQRLNAKVRDAANRIAPTRPVTASIGIAPARASQDVTILLNKADDAAYRAKQAGGNRFFTAELPDPESEEAVDSGLRASNAG